MEEEYGVSGHVDEKDLKKKIKDLNCDFEKVKEYVEDEVIFS